ncbi:hypothetical protein [Curtobacterium sp. KT1]|uniref:hypothetical protein n=1 Tax=Curtobacterium sp. KT1 TaxID=3372858 RepID=UPI0037C1A521
MGLVIIAITLVVFGVSSSTEDAGSAGRGATLMVVGFPAGAVAIVIGVVQLSRGRR